MKRIEMRDLYAMAQRPGGVSTAEAREAYPGSRSHDLAGRLQNMVDSGRLSEVAVNEGRTRRRYVADASVPWAVAQARFERALRKATEERLAAGRTRIKGWQAVDAEAAAKRAKKVVHRVIDGRRVPVEICPSGTDVRFSVTRAPKVFRSLACGSYLPGDSAIARAYA